MSSFVTVARSVRLFVLLTLVALVAACAPSSAEIRQARSAEYDRAAYEKLFEACREAMIESEYDIAGEDPQHGLIVSTWRWYSKEGGAKNKVAPKIEEGAAMFRIAVEIAPGPTGGFIVKVDGGAQGYTTGTPVAQAFAHGDPREPTWVEGKIDNLAVTIHQKAAGLQLKPAPAASK